MDVENRKSGNAREQVAFATADYKYLFVRVVWRLGKLSEPALLKVLGRRIGACGDLRQETREQAIAYLRVSTQRQHRSGLGIDAQRSAIERFAAAESLNILAEFVEAEIGKGSDALDRRPQLAAAKAAKCSVVVAKLDRLSRDVAFCTSTDELAGPPRDWLS